MGEPGLRLCGELDKRPISGTNAGTRSLTEQLGESLEPAGRDRRGTAIVVKMGVEVGRVVALPTGRTLRVNGGRIRCRKILRSTSVCPGMEQGWSSVECCVTK